MPLILTGFRTFDNTLPGSFRKSRGFPENSVISILTRYLLLNASGLSLNPRLKRLIA